jgi:hypothetical protein
VFVGILPLSGHACDPLRLGSVPMLITPFQEYLELGDASDQRIIRIPKILHSKVKKAFWSFMKKNGKGKGRDCFKFIPVKSVESGKLLSLSNKRISDVEAFYEKKEEEEEYYIQEVVRHNKNINVLVMWEKLEEEDLSEDVISITFLTYVAANDLIVDSDFEIEKKSFIRNRRKVETIITEKIFERLNEIENVILDTATSGGE